MKKCPFCAEEIKDEALKCRYCGSVMPEVEQKAAEEKTQAQKKQEETEIKMTISYAKEKLKQSYQSIAAGCILGGIIAAIYRSGVITNVSWFFIPTGIIIGGYCTWSLFWGCQIVSGAIKNHYSNLFLFGTGAVDLLVRRITMIISMYLFVIPFFGFLAGAFGGAIFKHFQFISFVKQGE